MAQVEFIDGVAALPAADWDGLFPGAYPFTRHAFLHALESTGCVGPGTGWSPCHAVLREDGHPVAVMPMYLKEHSYGEFVFDWAWASAYEQAGRSYYPKLLSAIPFTPAQGPRVGLGAEAMDSEVATARLRRLLRAVRRRVGREDLSGWHLLFPEPDLAGQLEDLSVGGGLLRRTDIQFHWHQRGEEDFEGFLARLKSSRRKTVRKERRRVAAQDVTVKRLSGEAIDDAAMAAFHACYVDTYRKRSGHDGYLDAACFGRLLETLREQMMIVLAFQQDEPVASAFFLFDDTTLYGRYWGSLADVDCLHFECCFYQGIEFCLERGLSRFDPGAQGEHKLLRGFEPVETRSLHWLEDARFRDAVEDYLARERRATRHYGDRAAAFLPFRREG